MPTIFVVRGVLADGTPVAQRIEASTLGEAEELAAAKGISVTAIARADATKAASGGGGGGGGGGGEGGEGA